VHDLRKKQDVCSFGAREKNAMEMREQTFEFSQVHINSALSLMHKRGIDRSNLLKIALDATIRAERDIHIEAVSDLANGYRPRRAFPHRKTLELQVPRTRYGNFKPMLLSVLKEQNEEMHRLCHSRNTKSLTTEQVGDVFEELYGHNYGEQWTSPRKTEGRISLSGLVGSQERLLEFRDCEVSEGGIPFLTVVGDFNPFRKNALHGV
jgi:hypothetical protein